MIGIYLASVFFLAFFIAGIAVGGELERQRYEIDDSDPDAVRQEAFREGVAYERQRVVDTLGGRRRLPRAVVKAALEDHDDEWMKR